MTIDPHRFEKVAPWTYQNAFARVVFCTRDQLIDKPTGSGVWLLSPNHLARPVTRHATAAEAFKAWDAKHRA
jgi:hypothetical protein